MDEGLASRLCRKRDGLRRLLSPEESPRILVVVMFQKAVRVLQTYTAKQL